MLPCKGFRCLRCACKVNLVFAVDLTGELVSLVAHEWLAQLTKNVAVVSGPLPLLRRQFGSRDGAVNSLRVVLIRFVVLSIPLFFPDTANQFRPPRHSSLGRCAPW
jgi:hypothetical protein